jgi:hypothetical protein
MSVINVNTNQEAFAIVARAIKRTESFDPHILCSCICEILDAMYGENDIDKLKEIGMSTTREIFTTIDTYIKMKYKRGVTPVTPTTVISKEARVILNKAISNVKTDDTDVICNEVVKILHETFPPEKYEYKATKLKMQTKEQIMNLISLYLFDHEEKGKIYRNVCSFLF